MGQLTKSEISVLYSVILCILIGVFINVFTGYSSKPVFQESRPKPLLININNADYDDLIKIPGMGRTNAKRVIEYREKHGSFNDISEIVKVKGIGPKRYEKMRPYITVK